MREARGDTEIVERAFRRHYHAVHTYFLRRTGDHQRSEDLAQDVFADAVSGLGRSAPGAPVLAWLYTVAQRRFVDDVRRRGRGDQGIVAAVRDDEPAARVDYGSEVARELKAALGRLPETDRRVLVLKLLEGRSFREVADALNTTEAAAKMRCRRALDLLREDLLKAGIEP